jgi:hypothetical protein
MGKRSTNASFPIGLGLGARVGPTLDAPGESVKKMVPHGVLVHLLEMWAGPLYRTTMTMTAKVECTVQGTKGKQCCAQPPSFAFHHHSRDIHRSRAQLCAYCWISRLSRPVRALSETPRLNAHGEPAQLCTTRACAGRRLVARARIRPHARTLAGAVKTRPASPARVATVVRAGSAGAGGGCAGG